ncbi:flagellar hook protein FlgE [Thermithiobacillus plumbiphilus]|uniref:Flagellar hook protein FlgE n=1 Tax=Thermithiobacillus plumbiphilus TaxID=1729899 RepID=A0ABU9DC79_9PROT
MSLRTGLSGLNAAATDLNVIGNNVSNANTVGFKKANAHFADSYAAAIANTAPTMGQTGIGVQVARIATEFTQGNIDVTNNPLDIAINGGGFFRLNDNGSNVYSRNGQFSIDKEGYVVNDGGARLTGYQVANGTVTGQLGDMRIDTADIAPKSSASVLANVNLPAVATPPTVTTFDANDPNSYNNATSLTVYDSLGVAHLATTYFVKTATDGQWNVYYQLDDGTGTTSTGTSTPSNLLTTLQFDDQGKVTSGGTAKLNVSSWGSGAAGSTIDFDLGSSTFYDSPFSVNTLTADGNASGRLSGLNVGADGNLFGRYSNGQSQVLGRVALSNFTNPNGLQNIGDNLWAATYASGDPLTGAPGSSNLGLLQSGAVEASNVDLTEELVAMITAQRTYQANAQTIKTEDQILQTLLTLR